MELANKIVASHIFRYQIRQAQNGLLDLNQISILGILGLLDLSKERI